MAFAYTETAFSATDTKAKLLDPKANRAYLHIQNNGTEDMRVALSDELTETTHTLIPAGAAYNPSPPPNNIVYVMRADDAVADVAGYVTEG